MKKVMVEEKEVVINHKIEKIKVKTTTKDEIVKEIDDEDQIKEGMINQILNIVFVINLVIIRGSIKVTWRTIICGKQE